MLSKCCARCLADVLIPEGIQVELARPEDRGKELTYLGREKGQPQAEPTEKVVVGSSAEALGHIAVTPSLRKGVLTVPILRGLEKVPGLVQGTGWTEFLQNCAAERAAGASCLKTARNSPSPAVVSDRLTKRSPAKGNGMCVADELRAENSNSPSSPPTPPRHLQDRVSALDIL